MKGNLLLYLFQILLFEDVNKTIIKPIIGLSNIHHINALVKLIFFSFAKIATNRERPNQDIQIIMVSIPKI